MHAAAGEVPHPGNLRQAVSQVDEPEQGVGYLFRCLLGLVVPRVDDTVLDGPGEPGLPDRSRVAVDVKVIAGRFQEHGRALDLASLGPVRFLILPVGVQSRPVVLAHAVHHVRIAQGRPQIVVVALSHDLWRWRAIPGLRVGTDHPLGRLVGLAQKPPVPPRLREVGIDAFEVLDDRKTVHDHQVGHLPRVVHRGAKSDERTAIVAHDSEPVVTEALHELDDILGHRALAGLTVTCLVRRQRGPAVASQVGHHRGAPPHQASGDPVPGGVGPWMAVQQHHRPPGSPMPHPQRDISQINVLKPKTLEHPHTTPLAPTVTAQVPSNPAVRAAPMQKCALLTAVSTRFRRHQGTRPGAVLGRRPVRQFGARVPCRLTTHPR